LKVGSKKKFRTEHLHQYPKTWVKNFFLYHSVAKGIQKSYFQLKYQYVSPPWCISRKSAKKRSKKKLSCKILHEKTVKAAGLKLSVRIPMTMTMTD
jgi:hypothetical protein